ncbi:ABC transporter substrate-binding protein [Pelobacter seleniigenes]|uniref:ABC transporter substrate-binding protein n=1 Tax=Pelobacter seleniigenes TaxID=407188 RepID=UPI0004A75280|nr:ABC transporter substrate-binding protein [Pelobacter seleniigenes]
MQPALGMDLKIAEIIDHYPATRQVFTAHGLASLVSEEGLRVLAPFLTLATALRSRGMDQQAFLKLLEEAVQAEQPLEAPGLDSVAEQGELTLLALMPCGLKVPFGRAISAFLTELKQTRGLAIRYAVEGNVNQELSYYPYINTLETVDELPDIIVSADFNAFYGQRFYQRFVADGTLVGYGTPDPGAAFQQAAILDPLGEYAVLGVNPLVMVANLDEIGDRPLPSAWQDLIEPCWNESLTLRGSNDFYCHAVLLPFYQKHGEAGLRKLAANVLRGLHPAQMVKQIDAGAPGAIYVMPEFFAHRVKNQQRIKIIWPADGALASPVTLQVKRSRVADLQPVLDYLTGPELAAALNGARFPVPFKQIDGEVQEQPLQWLGWDFLRGNDLLTVNAEIDRVFLPLVGSVLQKAAAQ